MIRFELLCKASFSDVSAELFVILADNMEKIAPTGNTREEDYLFWLSAMRKQLQDENRHIVLILDDSHIIGYFQYCLQEDIFFMEDIQFKKEWQGRNIFRALYGFVIPQIGDHIRYVKAYASTQNEKSIGILERLGLSKTGLNKTGRSFCFLGTYTDLLKWYHEK